MPAPDLAYPATKRALGKLVEDPAGARPVLDAFLAAPPAAPKHLAWFLAWAGRVALGPQPTRQVSTRSDLCALVGQHHEMFLAALRHVDRTVAIAATLPLAACRDHAADIQRRIAALEPNHAETRAAIQIATGVLSRATGNRRLLPHYPVRPGDYVYYADVIARQLDGDSGVNAQELVDAKAYGERALSKLPWFATGFQSAVRTLLVERPLDEREALAREHVTSGPIERAAVELVFPHVDDLPRTTREERLAATTFIRGLTPTQRSVLAAPQKYPPGLVGSTGWQQYRLPMTALGRAILLGNGDGPLATRVGDRPLYAALVDLLAEATLDRWKPDKHRKTVEVLVSSVDRAALSAAVHECKELGDPTGLFELIRGGKLAAYPL